MFKRHTVIIIIVFVLSCVVLWFDWKNIKGMELYWSSEVESVYRFSQDLNGKWNSYPSLREAWVGEAGQGNNKAFLSNVFLKKSIIIPSNEGFRVAAKKFRLTNKWGSRTILLSMSGVNGKARVYLNGIDNVHLLGEIEGFGGIQYIEVSPARFDYAKDNILLIEIMENSVRQAEVMSWLWPEKGIITGPIRLEAVPETNLDLSRTAVLFNSETKQLVVRTRLWRHNSLMDKPWGVKGILKAKGEKVAECLLPVNSNGEFFQSLTLLFQLNDPHFWTFDDPFLYELELILTNGRGDFDSLQMPVGIRNIAVESSGSWLLNGKTVNVKGIALSAEQEYKIRAERKVTSWLNEQKKKGINVIYFIEQFPDESWLFAADKNGMGIWAELPLKLVPQSRFPDPVLFEGLTYYEKRHPSLLSWTVVKGLHSPVAADSVNYLKKIKSMVSSPVYIINFTGEDLKIEDIDVLIAQNEGIKGEWGTVHWKEDTSAGTEWPNEKTAAILWLLWMIFVSFQKLRSLNWNYKQLFNPSPKRPLREAFFWRCMGLISRMGTLGGILTGLIYKLPSSPNPWFPYRLGLLEEIQNQSPLLIWFFASFLLVILRLLQAGVVAPCFPQSPGALGLVCWLEKRYGWSVLAAAAWVYAVFYFPAYLPLIVYFGFLLLLLPIRIKDVRRIGGKYRHFLVVPGIIFLAITIGLLWHWQDLLYLWKLVSSICPLSQII